MSPGPSALRQEATDEACCRQGRPRSFELDIDLRLAGDEFQRLLERGIFSPQPASSVLRNSRVRSETGPAPFVVLSRVSSWNTMSSPLLHNRTSSSIISHRSSRAFRNESSVFSGA